MTCLNCGKDIGDRGQASKRCVECSKLRRTIRMRDACKRYREKKKVLMTCWCGKEFRGSGNKDWCSSECIHGPGKPASKKWGCSICGSQTTNRLYCKACMRSNEDVESMTEHRR